MEVRGIQPTGESILQTLIELLEAQEQIKITYEIKEKEAINERFKQNTGVTQEMA